MALKTINNQIFQKPQNTLKFMLYRTQKCSPSKAWHVRLDSHENLANISKIIFSVAYTSSNKDKLFNAPHPHLNFLLVTRLLP